MIYSDLDDFRDTRTYKAYENTVVQIVATFGRVTSRQIKDELGDLNNPLWTAECLSGLCRGRIKEVGVNLVRYEICTPNETRQAVIDRQAQNAFANYRREHNRSVVTESFWRA